MSDPRMTGLVVWVLYRPTTKDYPGEWVVRRQRVSGYEIVRDEDLSARGATKRACLENLAELHPETDHLTWLPRVLHDDPVIEGVLV